MAFFDDIRESELKELFRHWLQRRNGCALPLRKDIGPTGINPAYLPHLFMYRREVGGRLRCILIGSEIVAVFHRDETGRYLDEIVPPESGSSRLKLYARCVDEARPIYYAGPALIPTGDRRRVCRLLLPLSSDGVAADHVFGMALFGPLLNNGRQGTAIPLRTDPAAIAVAGDEDLQQVS